MSTVQSIDDLYAMLFQAKPALDFPAGTVIFSKGDEGDAMYMVAEGSVRLLNGDDEVSTIAAPGMFGELSLIDNSTRSLTAVTAVDSKLLVLPTRLFWVLIHETPYFAKLVMTTLAVRLRDRDNIS